MHDRRIRLKWRIRVYFKVYRIENLQLICSLDMTASYPDFVVGFR